MSMSGGVETIEKIKKIVKENNEKNTIEQTMILKTLMKLFLIM